MLFFFKDTISLPLAIQDYLPVTLFGIGLFFVSRIVTKSNQTAGTLALIGGVLVTLGGLFKSTWKLIQALGGNDISILNNSLFVLMSAGFICLAWAFWKRRSSERSFSKIFSIPVLLIALVWLTASYFGFIAGSRVWFFVLLGVTTVANIALLIQLLFASVKNGLWLAVVLFSVNLVCIFYLARSSDQTVTFQWLKQIVNTFSQIAFLIGAILLFKNRPKIAIGGDE